jgi:thioesterase superfamily protein 4
MSTLGTKIILWDYQYSAMGESAIVRLSRTPWCHALISSPHWTPTSTDSRLPKASSEDSFFAETLATDRTIRACLTLRPTAEYKDDDGEPDKWIVYDEVRTILEIGDGLNGHPKIAHGGFVATMLDEVMGVLITRNIQARVERKKRRGESTAEVMSCFTACRLLVVLVRMTLMQMIDLNTTYRKPLSTPGILLCTAKFDRRERNKIYLRGTVEDGLGTVYVTPGYKVRRNL